MGFVVYINWTVRRGRVHRDDCTHYRSRKTEEQVSGRSDEWMDSPPFDSRDEAFAALEQAMRVQNLGHDHGPCGNCRP
ncbi:MAG: hypothetical protein HYY93_06750 [Planctomycetes bacterium]|nr:hypothetical protein [Planctomycetota bacterium]